LMTNSDNVLRAGLTPKHMDVEELETVMSTSVHEHCSLSPEKTPQGRLFRVPSYFSMLEVKKGSTSFKGGSVKIAFCVDGKCKIGSVLLNKGECCLIDAEEKDVLIENNGSTFIASNDK